MSRTCSRCQTLGVVLVGAAAAGQPVWFPDLNGDQFGAFVGGELNHWAQVVKAPGAKLN